MGKRNKSNHSEGHNFNQILDEALDCANLKYSELDFNNPSGDLLKSYKEINSKIHHSPQYFKNLTNLFSSLNFNIILKPAFTVIITSIIIFAIIKFKQFNKPVQYAEIVVEQGEKVTLHVNEQFTVYLNSGSTIKVPTDLKRKSKILFEGEAYFKINQDKNVTIVSNGIHFSLRKANFTINSDDTKQLVANIENGEINMYNPDMPPSTKLKLQKGDQATFNPYAKFIVIEELASKNYLAWHTKQLEFSNEPIYSVVKTISNYFEVPIAVDNDKLIKQEYSAKFSNPDIDEILDNIRSTFNCQISADGSKIVIN